MKYFSTPADFKLETIDKFHELNSRYEDCKVIETYGQLTEGKVINSGRVTGVLPSVDLDSLEQYVDYSLSKNIEFNYTLNPACFGNFEFSEEGIKAIRELLGNLYNIGIEWLTITSPALMELVRASRYKFKVKASAICEINSPRKALFYKNLGTGRIVVDTDITRNFTALRDICDTYGDGVEIIINNVCYKNCAYKMFHYNHEAHCVSDNTSQTIKDYYTNRCSMQKAEKATSTLKLNWIRPEDLVYYRNTGISYFKIQGRQNVLQGDIARVIESYFKEEYDGNLYDLITIFAPYNAFQPYVDNKKLDGFIKPFVESGSFCRDMCDRCNYCNSYAQKCMDREKVEELNEKALLYYKNFDSFTREIK